MTVHLPAEWHPQHAIQITWPHEDTDWNWILEDVQTFYLNLALIILKYENLIICVPNQSYKQALEQSIVKTLQPNHPFSCDIFICASNDSWARDHGPITVFNNGQATVLDFQFNGWGNKFKSELDNQITQNLFTQNAYPADHISQHSLILEGGSIECDGFGTLLTTEKCLLNQNRNPDLNKQDIENALQTTLGTHNILWLNHGDLEGDDTDAHIDTLARLAPGNQIIYQGCDSPDDLHYKDLNAMKHQLGTFKNAQGQAFELVELPMPQAIFEDGQRLPATYANFLFINDAVLQPIYNVPQDELAIKKMQSALPDFKIIPLDCSLLIRQYGSLHCITMQIPDLSDSL
jgi:agmatine deiminase